MGTENNSVSLVDTHCHLDFIIFDDDREDVLKRARDAGVVIILNPGIDLKSSKKCIKLAESHSNMYAAVGVHPNHSIDWRDDSIDRLREMADHPKVVAIGEIGLDYYRDKASREHQRRIFIEQLRLAAQLNLPVIIHNRQAMSDLRSIINDWQAQLVDEQNPLADHPGVLHSYSGTSDDAQSAIERNFMIGITGPVTFNNAQELRDVVATIPIDRLLIETDAPFLTPHPNRGKRNEPAFVRLVAEKISELFSMHYEDIATKTTANASNLFHW